MSAETYATAFKSRLAVSETKPCLDADEAQDLARLKRLPADYIVIYLQRRSTDVAPRVGGTFEPSGWYLSTEVNSKSISNARQLDQLVFDALVLNPVVLDGLAVDVRLETPAAAFEPSDAGYYTATTDWIFVR